MILHLKAPKKLHQKSPRYYKQLQQVAGNKIIFQKSVAFLYTNNEQIEKEKFHLQ
jgi:hypothetical protein